MRIVLLAENWPPRQGGIENYLTAIATHLPRGSTTVIAPPGSVAASGIAVITRRFFWPIVKPSWLPLFLSIWQMHKKRPLTVVLCGKALFEGLIGYYLKKYRGVPYIVFTYAMEISTWRRGRRRTVARVIRGADRIVYINNQTKQLLLGLGAVPSQLVKIWPGINPDSLTQVRKEEIAAIRKQYQLNSPYVLCVARLVERKGIDLLIESFAALDQTKFSEINLVIVGQGPRLGELQRIAQKNYIAPRVKFLTDVPTVELNALYAGSLFFAMTPRELPDDSEGFGIVYLEANSQKKAVLGTKTGGVPEAVIDGQTGIIVDPVPQKITAAMTTLLTDATLRDRLGQAGYERVVTEFDWTKRIALVRATIDAAISDRKIAS